MNKLDSIYEQVAIEQCSKEEFKTAILELFKEVVPKKKYHVATITKATYESQNDEGFNSCIDQMNERIKLISTRDEEVGR
jgi:hypothetical protein